MLSHSTHSRTGGNALTLVAALTAACIYAIAYDEALIVNGLPTATTSGGGAAAGKSTGAVGSTQTGPDTSISSTPVGSGSGNVGDSGQMGAQQSGMINMNSNSRQEKISIGNKKTTTNNYNGHHFKPTQLTQLVLNVPPPPPPVQLAPPAKEKVTRKQRPPTEEEMEVKEKILDLFNKAKSEKQEGKDLHMNHLGKVLKALNAKYIATQPVRRVVFADPNQLSKMQIYPYAGVQAIDSDNRELTPEERSREETERVQTQLDDLLRKFAQEVQFTPEFLTKLAEADETQMSVPQLVFKHLINCVTNPTECTRDLLCSSTGAQQLSVDQSLISGATDDTNQDDDQANQQQQQQQNFEYQQEDQFNYNEQQQNDDQQYEPQPYEQYPPSDQYYPVQQAEDEYGPGYSPSGRPQQHYDQSYYDEANEMQHQQHNYNHHTRYFNQMQQVPFNNNPTTNRYNQQQQQQQQQAGNPYNVDYSSMYPQSTSDQPNVMMSDRDYYQVQDNQSTGYNDQGVEGPAPSSKQLPLFGRNQDEASSSSEFENQFDSDNDDQDQQGTAGTVAANKQAPVDASQQQRPGQMRPFQSTSSNAYPPSSSSPPPPPQRKTDRPPVSPQQQQPAGSTQLKGNTAVPQTMAALKISPASLSQAKVPHQRYQFPLSPQNPQLATSSNSKPPMQPMQPLRGGFNAAGSNYQQQPKPQSKILPGFLKSQTKELPSTTTGAKQQMSSPSTLRPSMVPSSATAPSATSSVAQPATSAVRPARI